MKNIIKILFLFSFISCKAQTILNIEDECGGIKSNIYYKDVNNLLNPYEGTWKYQNGNEILLIKLKKVFSITPINTEDILVGEYQYIDVNGIEKINTLNNFDIVNQNQDFHAIYGNCINNYEVPICDNCDPTIKKVVVMYDDPVKDVMGNFYLAKTSVSGVEAIQMFVKTNGNRVIDNSTSDELVLEYEYAGVTIPKGWYPLIKQ